MSAVTNLRDLVLGSAPNQREQRLRTLEQRLQKAASLLERNMERGGEVLSNGRFRRWNTSTREQKCRNLTQLREALDRIHQNMDHCRNHRQTQRLLAAGQLATTVLGAVVPGTTTAGAVVSAGLGAYRRHRAPQDRPDTPILRQALGTLDGTFETLIRERTTALLVEEVQQAIPASSVMPKFLLNAIVQKVGDLAGSLISRLSGSHPA